MDRWMGEWIDGWVNGWMNEWMDGQVPSSLPNLDVYCFGKDYQRKSQNVCDHLWREVVKGFQI
jgi:hypothetical protein